MKLARLALMVVVLSIPAIAAPIRKPPIRKGPAKIQQVKPMAWAGECFGNACAHCAITVYPDNSVENTCLWDGTPGGCGCFLKAGSDVCIERGTCHLTQTN